MKERMLGWSDQVAIVARSSRGMERAINCACVPVMP
jgi:hypothetical protein